MSVEKEDVLVTNTERQYPREYYTFPPNWNVHTKSLVSDIIPIESQLCSVDIT